MTSTAPTCTTKCTTDCGRCKGNPGPDALNVCKWYVLCFEPAIGVVDHPVLGQVPCCQRCADKHGMTPDPY